MEELQGDRKGKWSYLNIQILVISNTISLVITHYNLYTRMLYLENHIFLPYLVF